MLPVQCALYFLHFLSSFMLHTSCMYRGMHVYMHTPYTIHTICVAGTLRVPSHPSALDVQGIYRLSGAKKKLERLSQLFETAADRLDLTEQNPHLVASLLKMYLRRLPEPLMTFELYKDFISIASVSATYICTYSTHIHTYIHMCIMCVTFHA